MSEPFIGEIRIWANNFVPRGWLPCNGQLIPVSQNTALFSILGTAYGGDGRVTFGLPNLQTRAPMKFGAGPGLPVHQIGQVGGSDGVTLTAEQLPRHTHTLSGYRGPGNSASPVAGAFMALDTGASGENLRYLNNTPATRVNMSPAMMGNSGQSLPHENRQPYLALSFCIAAQGLFPARS